MSNRFDDVMIFIVEKIIAPFFIIAVILFICLCVIGIFFIPSCIEQVKKNELQIQQCFMQETKTKECDYMIWKYELKHRQPKNNTKVTPMPIIIR